MACMNHKNTYNDERKTHTHTHTHEGGMMKERFYERAATTRTFYDDNQTELHLSMVQMRHFGRGIR